MTSHVISGLKPFTSYRVSMASVDINGMEGIRSVSTPPLITEEAGLYINCRPLVTRPLACMVLFIYSLWILRHDNLYCHMIF